MQNQKQGSNNSGWLDDDALNEEWSFNIEPSFIDSSQDNNENDETRVAEDTLVIDKETYEEMVATSEAIKIQMKELMKMVEDKEKEDQEKELKMAELESERENLKEEKQKEIATLLGKIEQEEKEKEMLKRNLEDLEKKLAMNESVFKSSINSIEGFLGQIEELSSCHAEAIKKWKKEKLDQEKKIEELVSEGVLLNQKVLEMTEKLESQEKNTAQMVKKGTQKIDVLKNTVKNLQETLGEKELSEAKNHEKIQKLEKDLHEKTEEIRTVNRKYSNLKKRGVQMLDEKNKDIKKTQKELEQQKKMYEEQLDAMESTVKLESEKREKFEKEVKMAEKIVKDALKEEKRSRKQAEKHWLGEKTERMAYEEKTSRGVIVHKACPNPEHNLLIQRIDVLHRQRDLLVESITQRDSGPEDTIN